MSDGINEIAALRSAPCWIFDLDGTLTVPVHDFDGLRAQIGLAPGAPILEAIRNAPPEEARRLSREVDEWEQSLAGEPPLRRVHEHSLSFYRNRAVLSAF